jgi:hypothetical protein
MDQFSGVKDQQDHDLVFVFSSLCLSVPKIYPEFPGIMLAMFGKTPSPLVTNELKIIVKNSASFYKEGMRNLQDKIIITI